MYNQMEPCGPFFLKDGHVYIQKNNIYTKINHVVIHAIYLDVTGRMDETYHHPKYDESIMNVLYADFYKRVPLRFSNETTCSIETAIAHIRQYTSYKRIKPTQVKIQQLIIREEDVPCFSDVIRYVYHHRMYDFAMSCILRDERNERFVRAIYAYISEKGATMKRHIFDECTFENGMLNYKNTNTPVTNIAPIIRKSDTVTNIKNQQSYDPNETPFLQNELTEIKRLRMLPIIIPKKTKITPKQRNHMHYQRYHALTSYRALESESLTIHMYQDYHQLAKIDRRLMRRPRFLKSNRVMNRFIDSVTHFMADVEEARMLTTIYTSWYGMKIYPDKNDTLRYVCVQIVPDDYQTNLERKNDMEKILKYIVREKYDLSREDAYALLHTLITENNTKHDTNNHTEAYQYWITEKDKLYTYNSEKPITHTFSDGSRLCIEYVNEEQRDVSTKDWLIEHQILIQSVIFTPKIATTTKKETYEYLLNEIEQLVNAWHHTNM